VDKNPAKVFVVFLDPVIKRLDVRLVEKAQNLFL